MKLKPGKARLPSALDAASSAAIVQLAQNGFTYPPGILPNDWSLTTLINDTEPHFAPGPEHYEHKPLRKAISTADVVFITLYGFGHGPGDAVRHAGPEHTAWMFIELLNAHNSKQRVLYIKTLWHWLAPWLAKVRRHRRSGAKVKVFDSEGGYSVVSRASTTR